MSSEKLETSSDFDDNLYSASHESTIVCDACLREDKNSVATVYCIDCNEHQCKACNRFHGKLRASRKHRSVELSKLNENPTFEQVKRKREFSRDSCQSEEKAKYQFAQIESATVYCLNCEKFQYADCNEKHRPSTDHSIITLGDALKRKIAKSITKKRYQCDVCKNEKNRTDEIPIAVMHCSDCNENQCAECCGFHGKLTISQNHKIDPLNEVLAKEMFKKLIDPDKLTRNVQCGICKIRNEGSRAEDCIPLATIHCFDCDEHMCDRCSKYHQKQKISKSHTVAAVIVDMTPDVMYRSTATLVMQSEFRMRLFSQLLQNIELPDLLSDSKHSQISAILDRPKVKEQDLENYWCTVLPYLIQRLKMWNGYAVTPQNLIDLIERSKRTRRQVIDSESLAYPVARIDCLTILLNAADCLVAQNILNILAKFHMAIPLVIRDLKESNTFIVTLPIIQNIVIKWEPTPGQIIENHLFTNPFRMVVAVRIGKNKIGKSTILNQMMRKQYVFSSYAEYGSEYGRPIALDGSVEMLWLTQETCSDTIWKLMKADYYQQNQEDAIILANLHGDALDFIETVEFLATITSSFIVFQMPDCTEEKLHQFKEIVSNIKIVDLLVDPKCDEEEIHAIYSDSLNTHNTDKVITDVLKLGLDSESKQYVFNDDDNATSLGKSLKFSHSMRCHNSYEIVKIARALGCLKIKKLIINYEQHEVGRYDWTEHLRPLVNSFLQMFSQSSNEVKKSLTFLDAKLCELTRQESTSAHSEVVRTNQKLREIKMTRKTSYMCDNLKVRQHENAVKEAKEALKSFATKPEQLNVGQEHFFRLLGHIYEKRNMTQEFAQSQQVLDLPDHVADLLISGHAVEMLNGDTGGIQSVWLSAIFQCIVRRKPNLKVYVISIIGLQSSGKSTLLNALFSCRFAVSMGRCSRGLFMRMIFLDQDLKESHGFDCILLIDTEGLCSAEKLNDKETREKDRRMATFAMGISNLTLVNILGEGLTEITDILQIAIVAMARLRVGGFSPDILIIQHLQERNEVKLDQVKSQFCESINEAFKLLNEKDIEIGSASRECLDELTARIQSGDIFKYFGAFKDGSSVNSRPSETYHEDIVDLYRMLLEKIKDCGNQNTVEHWFCYFESLWSCVKKEHFALNFKNVKDIADFLHHTKKIAIVKEHCDRAIRSHREFLSKNIREVAGSLVTKNRKLRTEEMSHNLLADLEKILDKIPYSCLGTTYQLETDSTTDSTDGTQLYCRIKEGAECDACKKFQEHHRDLIKAISGTERKQETEDTLKSHQKRLLDVTMNMLKQAFNGSVLKQGILSEFSDLIERELEKALKRRPSAEFCLEEQTNIIDNIWTLLENLALAMEIDYDNNLDERFNQALTSETVIKSLCSDVLDKFKVPVTVQLLSTRISYETSNINVENCFDSKPADTSIGRLSQKELTDITDELARLVKNVLENAFARGPICEEDMVKDMIDKFHHRLTDFEMKYGKSLREEFIKDLQLYTLQQLRYKTVASNDIHKKMNQALEREYVQTGVFVDMLEDFAVPMTAEHLSEKNYQTYDGIHRLSNENHINNLTSELDNLVVNVLKKRGEYYHTDGLDFEEGMVSEIKNAFPSTIIKHEEKIGIQLNDRFKIDLQTFTLQQLRNKMIDPQSIWNGQNKPSEILKQRKQDYVHEIEIRLKHGFSGTAEGEIFAMNLLNSIKEAAVETVYSLNVRAVKRKPWIANSEKIRLHYFSGLAKEVAKGEKKRALKHFSNPKESIERWFTDEIDSISLDEDIESYEECFNGTLDKVIQDIESCSTKSAIDDTVKRYTHHGSDHYYRQPVVEDSDIETFKRSISSKLREFLSSDESKIVSFPRVSEDVEIKRRLGCTECCFWCGALCWGSRDHRSDKGTYMKFEVHHSCHQPRGLKGVSEKSSNKLRPGACHNIKDDTTVWLSESDTDGMTWQFAKMNRFKDWNFDVHYIKVFDQLMCWFFQELHKDIAKHHKTLPTGARDLEASKCSNLNLENILAVIESR